MEWRRRRNPFNSHYQPVHIEEEIVERAKKARFTPQTANAEVLTELRHFGADTTLIDFSRNLLIALFFACNGEHDKANTSRPVVMNTSRTAESTH